MAILIDTGVFYALLDKGDENHLDAIAVEPEVILMDEPCSALDPITTQRIEKLIRALREHYTIVIVTHNIQQAYRISDYTAFLYMGRLVEFGPTKRLFEEPREKLTMAYLSGDFG